jgi:ASPIC/UnbV protein
MHFGMAHDRVALRIEIRWPSRIRQTVKVTSADQILQIDEPNALSGL